MVRLTSGAFDQEQPGRRPCRRRMKLPEGDPEWLVLLSLLLWLPSCDSTALTLLDPNTFNASLDPEFIGSDVTELELEVRMQDAPETDDSPTEVRVVVDYDLGSGLYLVAWRFLSDFSLVLTIQRTADAPRGTRPLSLQIRNAEGTFLVQGEFTVL